MRFRTAVIRVSGCRNRAPPFLPIQAHRFFSQLQPTPQRNSNGGSSFGIAFDIDGVILRGRVPVGGSPRALRRLYDDSGASKVPFLFLTNGGGVPESRRAIELSGILGVSILQTQVLFRISRSRVVQGHSPFKNLLNRYENELIVATGKGEPAVVMSEYGFKKVLSLDEYASYFENIDPVSQYKTWKTGSTTETGHIKAFKPSLDILPEKVQAAFVVSDPVDWGRDIQVLCDILKSGGLPGQNYGDQPALYFAADDLEYQAAFPTERLGLGAFRTALECIFNRVHNQPLQYTSFGKPNPFVFKNAEKILGEIKLNNLNEDAKSHSFETIYMIGDNPPVDVNGAQQAGHPWFSILTRTGVFRGKDNDSDFPADMVVDTVEEAVEYILHREGCL